MSAPDPILADCSTGVGSEVVVTNGAGDPVPVAIQGEPIDVNVVSPDPLPVDIGGAGTLDVNLTGQDVPIEVTLDASDLQIGAVEIKNSTNDDRAQVGIGSGSDPGDMALYVADGVNLAIQGGLADAAVITDAGGTHSQKLRGLVALAANAAGVRGATTDLAVATDSDGTTSGKLRGIVTLLLAGNTARGTAADAGVVTDAVGTVSAKLRGIVTLLLAGNTNAGTTADAGVVTDAAGSLSAKLRGVVTLLLAGNTNAGTTTDAAVTSNANGSLSAKMRGIVTILADVWVDAQNSLRIIGNVASGAADSGDPVKVGGVFNLVAPVLDTGDRGDVQLDVSGRQIITPGTLLAGEDLANAVFAVNAKPVSGAAYSWTAFSNFGAATAISVKAGPGNLGWIVCTNENAAVRFLQIHNKASAPAAAEVPLLSFPIPAGTAAAPAVLIIGVGTWGQGGQFLSTGVAVGISTTEGTYTAATATDHTLAGGSV